MPQSDNGKIPQWFTAQILGLGHIYRQKTIEPPMIAAWWAHIRDIEPEHIATGIAAAVRESPMYMPTAEQVRTKAIESRKHVSDLRARERAEREHENVRTHMLEEHIRETDSGRALAEKWRKQSEDRGLCHNGRVPTDMARERLADIQSMLDGHVP